MNRIPPYVFISFDSCGLGPPTEEEKQAVKKLLDLIEKHDVQVGIPQAVLEETNRASKRIKKIASQIVFNYDLFNQEDCKLLHKVEEMLFGRATDLTGGQINDARNLVCSKKHCCSYFVTYDKRDILSKCEEIESELGFKVVTPSECLEALQAYLK